MDSTSKRTQTTEHGESSSKKVKTESSVIDLTEESSSKKVKTESDVIDLTEESSSKKVKTESGVIDLTEESSSKKVKTENEESDISNLSEDEATCDLTLTTCFGAFVARPVFTYQQPYKDLQVFLVEHGDRVKKLNYSDEGELYNELILQYCTNLNDVTVHFTDQPGTIYMVGDDDICEGTIKFLIALAPELARLETVNKMIGLHHLSRMERVYENFSDKIKFLKTDELKPEELSVLAGYNSKDNPALSLEELIFYDNYLLYSERTVETPESIALRPASLIDLIRLKNLRRIDLPFFLNEDKIPRMPSLPRLTYACVRLLSDKKGTLSTSPIIENIGLVLANINELKLCNSDPGLLVLHSILTNCKRLEKLDLSELHVNDDYKIGLATLSGTKPTFKQLNAKIRSSDSHEIDLILYFINNVTSLNMINIEWIPDVKYMQKIIAASTSLAEKVQHDIELNLTWVTIEEETPNVPKELTSSKSANLKVCVNFRDH